MFTCQVQGHSSSLCPQCLPDCELTTYTYTTSSVPFRFLPQKIILTTFGRFDHMYIKSDAATREIWTWVPSVTLAPSPPCWSGNPLWLSKFNQKNLIYDVLRHRKITNAIHQVMSTYSGTGINTPYTTGLPSPMRRHVFLYINYESMYWFSLFDFRCFWVIFFQYFENHVLDLQGISWIYG